MNNILKIYTLKKIVNSLFHIIKLQIFYLFFIPLILAQISLGAGTLFGAKTIDRIIAIVNNEIVTLYDLNMALEPYISDLENAGFPDEKKQAMAFSIREKIINKLIDELLTDQEIKKNKISIGEAEVENAIERIKEMNRSTEEELKYALEKEGITLKEYRKTLAKELARSKLIDFEVKSKIVITDEDIEKYYNENLKEYEPKPEYHLRNIIKIVPEYSNSEEKEQIYQKIKVIMAKLQVGLPFEEVARDSSDSPFAAEGGYLGGFKLEDLSPVISEGLKGKKPGEFTDIILTEQGYQIFYIEKTDESTKKTIDEVTDEIQKLLYKKQFEKKFQAWLNGVREEALIKTIK